MCGHTGNTLAHTILVPQGAGKVREEDGDLPYTAGKLSLQSWKPIKTAALDMSIEADLVTKGDFFAKPTSKAHQAAPKLISRLESQ